MAAKIESYRPQRTSRWFALAGNGSKGATFTARSGSNEACNLQTRPSLSTKEIDMQSGPITNTADLIHTDDLFSRIKWLEQELNYRCSDDYSEELKALKSLARTVETTTSERTYQRSAELIRDSYLPEYRKGLDEAARANTKFSSVDFDGVTYWLRH
jgi:hypothetical protein